MRLALAGLMALAPVTTVLRAQSASLDSIGPGCCTVRIKSRDGSAQGRFQGTPAPGRVVLTPCKGALCPSAGATNAPVTIPSGAQVELYQGRSAGKGAIWGAAVGAVLLTAVWLDNPDLDMSTGAKIAAGLPLGALGGSVIGAIIGAFFPRWKPVRP